MQPGFCRFDGPSLHKKNAGNNLKRVGHAVAKLGEQHLLLLQQLLQGALALSALGRILESEQNGRLAIAFVEDLSGIEQHRATPASGSRARPRSLTSPRARGQSFPVATGVPGCPKDRGPDRRFYALASPVASFRTFDKRSGSQQRFADPRRARGEVRGPCPRWPWPAGTPVRHSQKSARVRRASRSAFSQESLRLILVRRKATGS